LRDRPCDTSATVEITAGANSGRNRLGGDLEDEEGFLENYTSLIQRGFFIASLKYIDKLEKKP